MLFVQDYVIRLDSALIFYLLCKYIKKTASIRLRRFIKKVEGFLLIIVIGYRCIASNRNFWKVCLVGILNGI